MAKITGTFDWWKAGQPAEQSAPFSNLTSMTPSGSLATRDPFDLSGMTNQFMIGQTMAPYLANIPGFMQRIGQQSKIAGEQMSGMVGSDVVNHIIQSGAERGILTGMPGSPANSASWLRALGLTSMGLQQQGFQNMGALIGQMPVPEVFNPASLFVPERFAAQELAAYKETSKPTTQKVGNVTTTTTPQGWAPNYSMYIPGG